MSLRRVVSSAERAVDALDRLTAATLPAPVRGALERDLVELLNRAQGPELVTALKKALG